MFCATAKRKPSASRSRKALVPVPCTPDDNRLRLVEGRCADKQRRNARRLRKEKFARLGVKASAKRETVSGSWPRLSFLVIRYRCLFFVINLYIIPVRIRWLGGCRPSRQEEPYYLILPNLHSHIPLIINDHGHHLPTS